MFEQNIKSCNAKGDVTRNESQQRFLAQHSVAMLEQCCNHVMMQGCVALKIVVANRLGEGNENGEKTTTIGLICKKATLHVQHTFFVHFCRCFARLQREKLPETS